MDFLNKIGIGYPKQTRTVLFITKCSENGIFIASLIEIDPMDSTL